MVSTIPERGNIACCALFRVLGGVGISATRLCLGRFILAYSLLPARRLAHKTNFFTATLVCTMSPASKKKKAAA